MATVTGMTAAAMQAIADESIVDGEIVGSDLILTTRGGTPINAGEVVGPTGAPGVDGDDGAPGATGPAGPTALVGDPTLIATSTPGLTTSGVIVGLSRSNVPVVINHTYSLHADFAVDFSSVNNAAEWHFWFRLNGVTLERFFILKPVVTGVSFQNVKGTVFWDAPATASTDDFDVWAQEVQEGAIITPTGAATLKRKFWIVDHGIV